MRHHHRRRFHGEAVEAENGERTTTRVQLEMPPQAMERLQNLKDRTEAASYAEVIRNALRLFEALVDMASGAPSKSEALGFGTEEIVPWRMGAVV